VSDPIFFLVLVTKCWLNHIRILIYASGFLPNISWHHYIAGAFQNGKNIFMLFFLWSTWLRHYGYCLWRRSCSDSQLFPPPPETMGEYRFVVGIRSCWTYFKLESAAMGSFCFLNTDRNGNATLSAANKCDLELGVCKYTREKQNQFHISVYTGLFKMIVRVQLSNGNSAPNSGTNHHLTIPLEGGMHSFKRQGACVSRNWRYESEPPLKPSPLTCYKQFGTNSIIVLIFVESQRVHI